MIGVISEQGILLLEIAHQHTVCEGLLCAKNHFRYRYAVASERSPYLCGVSSFLEFFASLECLVLLLLVTP